MNLDRIAREAVKKRRRKLLVSVLEVALGDLVALDGIEATRETIQKFNEQLDH